MAPQTPEMVSPEPLAGLGGSGGPKKQQLQVELRPATPADVPALAELLAVAFEGNPAYRWIFTNDPSQPAPPGALRWTFERRAAVLLQQRCLVLVAEAKAPPGAAAEGGGRDAAESSNRSSCGSNSEQLVGTVSIVPFDRKPGLWQYLWGGVLAWPLHWGLASLRRALGLDGGLAALLAGPLAGQGVTGELILMAVQPGCQGQGLGARLMEAALAQWDAEHAAASGAGGGGGGGGLVLATQEGHAARMYQRHGFVPVPGVPQGEPGKRGGAYANWLLVRPAAGVAAGAATGAAAEEAMGGE